MKTLHTCGHHRNKATAHLASSYGPASLLGAPGTTSRPFYTSGGRADEVLRSLEGCILNMCPKCNKSIDNLSKDMDEEITKHQ